MATIRDLYRDATRNKVKNDIYGGDASRIETKGLINIPRTVALLASSPNTVADAIGTQVSGLLKGSANRPSDTIFKNDKPFTKPITLQGGVTISEKKIKDVIQPKTNYFVKKSPAPASIFAKIKQGASTPLGLVAGTAASLLRNPIAGKKALTDLRNGLKKRNTGADMYGTQYMIDENGKKLDEIDGKKFSQYYHKYTKDNATNSYAREDGSITKRQTKNNWDLINESIIQFEKLNEESSFVYEDALNSLHKNNKITYVTIQPYGKDSSTTKIILPGTITGLTENFSPEWSNFKYVGSPFYRYRYSGIESSINFNLQLYYIDEASKKSMKESINKLKKLVFPLEELSVITYGKDESKRTDSLAFSPNLLTFSITGLYSNIFGYLEELNFTIDDNVSWATMGEDISGNKEDPYPTIFNVSMGIKVIPDVLIDGNKLSYNFDGYNKPLPPAANNTLNPKT